MCSHTASEDVDASLDGGRPNIPREQVSEADIKQPEETKPGAPILALDHNLDNYFFHLMCSQAVAPLLEASSNNYRVNSIICPTDKYSGLSLHQTIEKSCLS